MRPIRGNCQVRDRAVVAAVGLLLSFALPVAAATYHVATTGADVSPGSAEAPFRTLAKGVSVLAPGDVLAVQPGVYTGGVVLNRSGTPAQPVTLRGVDADKVVIQGRIVGPDRWEPVAGQPRVWVSERVPAGIAEVALDLETTDLVVCPLEVRAASVAQVAAQTYSWFHDPVAGRLYVNVGTGVPGRDRTVHACLDETGLTVPAGVHDVVVEGLTIADFARNGVLVNGAQNVTVRNCRLTRCAIGHGAGINLYHTEGVTVRNCAIWRLMTGVMAAEASRTTVDHVTVYRTRAHGVIAYRSRDLAVRNSILFAGGRSGAALYLRDAEAGLSLDHNCYLDYATSTLVHWGASRADFPTFWDYRAVVTDQDRHSLSADPQFVSTVQGAEDFRLQPGSPCRGRGEGGTDIGCLGGRRTPQE